MKSLPCFWICCLLIRNFVSSFPLEYGPKIGFEIQILSKSNFQPVITFQPIGEVRVNNVGRSKIQTFGYMEITDPREHCGKIRKYYSGSIAILITGVDECTFEEQVLYADRAKYDIVLVPFGYGRRIPSLGKNTELKFISTIALISFEDAVTLLEYAREASDRYYIKIRKRELKQALPEVRAEPAPKRRAEASSPNVRKKASNADDSPSYTAVYIIIAVAVIVLALTIIVVVKNSRRSRKPISRPRPQYQFDNGTTGAPLLPREVILPQDDDDLIDTTHCQKVWIESKEYTLVRLLGKGGFGSVWKARECLNESNEKGGKAVEHKYVVVKKVDFNPENPGEIDSEGKEESNANKNVDDPKMPLQSLLAGLMGASTNTMMARAEELKFHVQNQYQQFVQVHLANINRKCIQESYHREVEILQHLKKFECERFVIQMIGSEVNASESYGLILLEVGGQDLQTYLSKTQCGIKDFLEIWIKMIQAVKCVHQFGIAHLDIKPANFIWVQNRQYLKLIDFGNSYIIDSEGEDQVSVHETDANEDSPKEPKQKQIIGGTPGLISPEVILSTEIGTAADIWSLGCILYIMLQNEPLYPITKLQEQQSAEQIPIMRSAVDTIQNVNFCLKKNFGGNIEVSTSLARLVKGCIQFEPPNRFTATTLLQQSENVLSLINRAEASARAQVDDVMRMIRRIEVQNRYRPRAYGGGVNILGSFGSS